MQFIPFPLGSPRILLPVAPLDVLLRLSELLQPCSTIGRLAKRALLFYIRSGLVRFPFHSHSISAIQRRLPRELQPVLNEQVLDSVQADVCDVFAAEPLYIGYLVGSPGPYQKLIGLICDHGANPYGIVKVGPASTSGWLIEREGRMLNWLSSHNLQHWITPSVLRVGRTDTVQWHIQSLVPAFSPCRGSLTTVYVTALGELAKFTLEHSRLTELPFWSSLVSQQLDQRFEVVHAGDRQVVRDVAMSLRIEADRRRLESWPTCFNHGDFAPWNAGVIGSQVVAYDWEYASDRLPLGWDILMFVFGRGYLIQRLPLGPLITMLMGNRVHSHVNELATDLRAVIPDYNFLVRLFVVDWFFRTSVQALSRCESVPPRLADCPGPTAE